MGKHFLHLNFPFDIDMSEMVYREAANQKDEIQLFPINARKINTQLIDVLNKVGIFVPHAIIFVTQPKAHLFPHSDRAGAKLNVIYGKKGSRMFWWNTTATPNYHKTKVHTDYWQVPLDQCKLIESTEIGITLVDSDAIHSVMNSTNEPRYALSINLRDKNGNMIPFLDAAKRLKGFKND